ncbi:hypothetical protein DYB31_010344, partial [Aphanomyces astaci]
MRRAVRGEKGGGRLITSWKGKKQRQTRGGRTENELVLTLRGKYYSEDQKHATAISVYQRLHAFKFRPHASLDANLQAFDKLRTRWKSWKGIPSATAIYRGQLQA